MSDELYLKLKGAREKLCVAQTLLSDPRERMRLQEALDHIDGVAVMHCPQWSKYDHPTTEDPFT